MSTAIIFRLLFCIICSLSISSPERSLEVSTATFLSDLQRFALQTLSALHRVPSRILAFHPALWEWKSLVSHGSFVIWGLGAKGAIFLCKIDLTAEYISAVVNINPKKQGKYMPKTAHFIVSPETLRTLPISGIIVMNDNYLHEISASVWEICVDVPIYALGRKPVPV